LWIGDPAEIKTKRVRKKKTDREDARLMLRLLLENRFPKIWIPSPENRDLRPGLACYALKCQPLFKTSALHPLLATCSSGMPGGKAPAALDS
jgi:hypothetical protein